jgi:tetratricopeptide (TPR) repeat protein
MKLGRLDEARRVIARGLAYAEGHVGSLPIGLSYISTAQALVHLAGGEPHEALARAGGALGFADRLGAVLEQGAAHRALGQIHEAAGNHADAEAAYRRSLDIFEGIQSLPELGQSLLAYGRFRLRLDPEAGGALVERARSIFAKIGAAGWLREADAALVRT